MVRIINSLKYRLNQCFAYLRYYQLRLTHRRPKIMSIEQTIDLLNHSSASIARFGDGELNMIHSYNIGFQRYDPKLSLRLKEVLLSNSEQCLVALPQPIARLDGMVPRAKKTWKQLIGKYYSKYSSHFDFERVYPNSFLTRPYMDFIDKSAVGGIFQNIKKLWDGRKLLIVEGEKSKLGVGNDLFANSKKIRRIITAGKDAYAHYDTILNAIIELKQADELVILALGPTATVLAYDLSKRGVRAFDLGHVDIEYEWYLRKATNKIAIDGKDIIEATTTSIDTFSAVSSNLYQQEIICKIL